MRRLIVVCFAAVVTLAGSPASAQDVESLRREVEALRKQLQSVTERLQAMEARPAPPAPLPASPAAPVAAPAPLAQVPPTTTTESAAPAPTLADYARPHQPFALAERRGPGQLLFDIGVSTDLVANLTQRNVEKARAGTFAGQENRFFPRSVELGLFGQIDPYARGVARIEVGESVENGERGFQVEVSEAPLTLLTLPFSTQLKLGRMLNRFGMLNQLHEDDLPQTDRPNVLTRFLGAEGLIENGAELTWVAPLPFYLEALLGVFTGDNEDAFGRGSLRAPLLTARVRTFFELDDASAIQLGVSAASGETSEERRSSLAGVDLKYKLVPEGWRHPLLTLAGEALFASRKVDVRGDSDGDGIGDVGGTRTRKRWGWYAYAELQPWQRWALGFRYDWTQYPTAPGREWAVEPYLAFKPSEFLRFRLAYKHTDRTHRVTGPDDRGSARVVDEILFQASFILGAHPTDAF